jgi:dTDP-4-dehydrorhamnose reductase
MKQQKVLLLGCGGQVGSLLARHAPNWAEIVALDRSHVDLSDEAGMRNVVRLAAPDVIINAAAYTAVDRAETELKIAFQINAEAVRVLAEEATKLNARFVQYSTDYVFDGQTNKPYAPGDPKNPQSVYGLSKSRGEDYITGLLQADRYLILRTAWVYALGGHNFVTTMLRLMQSQPKLRVVCDQFGTPTSALNLAKKTWIALERDIYGLHHYTDAGTATWYDFACMIGKKALNSGMIGSLPNILPIQTADYPQAAQRPVFGVLDKQSFWNATDTMPEHWSEALERTWFEAAQSN